MFVADCTCDNVENFGGKEVQDAYTGFAAMFKFPTAGEKSLRFERADLVLSDVNGCSEFGRR